MERPTLSGTISAMGLSSGWGRGAVRFWAGKRMVCSSSPPPGAASSRSGKSTTLAPVRFVPYSARISSRENSRPPF
jgi:hypothetical protein